MEWKIRVHGDNEDEELAGMSCGKKQKRRRQNLKTREMCVEQ